MGNFCSHHNACPTHQSQKISKICMSEGCLEPLCLQCVQNHRMMHRKLGYPPKITQYSEIVEKVKRHQEKAEKQHRYDQRLKDILPRSTYVKDLTKQYFAERAKRKNLNHGGKVQIRGLLTDLEIWEEMKSKVWVKSKVKDFLKDNLSANNDVVGREYSHLYE